jgi:AcrR family transcriptional regulator
MLDAARELVLEDGSWSATMEAIAQASGAPTGSLYHRFGSRDQLLARLWVRAVQRSRASFIGALQKEDAREAARAAHFPSLTSATSIRPTPNCWWRSGARI